MSNLKLPVGHPYTQGRVCTTCGEFKPAEKYTLSKDKRAFGGVSMRSKCKPCDEFRKYKNSITRLYGITYDEYEQLLAEQNNSCKICESSVSFNSRTSGRLFVDHCHKTGRVRGLLCSKCNHALGLFNDDTKLLTNALKYLSSSNCNAGQ